jgi:hypothetical protein
MAQPSGDMWGVAAHFNPSGYMTKLQNLELFARRVRRQGLQLAIVELAFGDAAFLVPEECADMVVRVRSGSVMWQKERLINLAVARLPESCRKVVWLDGDILFTNGDWVMETSRLLEEHRAVQPFEIAAWLPRDGAGRLNEYAGKIDRLPHKPGSALTMRHLPDKRELLFHPEMVHPGFAWAARREILEKHGLCDRLILGGGDYVNMLAMYFDPAVLGRPDTTGGLAAGEIAGWMDGFHGGFCGDVAYAEGAVLHLWHGDLANRNYLQRYGILRDCGYSPRTDIALNADGCWEWSSGKPELHRRVIEYFASRREDG